MIGKLIKGKNPLGLFKYLLADKDHNGDIRPRVAILGGSFIGRNAKELAREMEILHNLRPTLGVHLIHMSLRVPEEERELVDNEWKEIADYWRKEMKIDGYVSVSHGDHVHIAASRIRLDGTVISDSNDYKKSETIIRKMEREFNLKKVESSHLLEKERAVKHRKAPTMAEIAIGEKLYKNKTTEKPMAELLRDILEMALRNNPTVSEFIDRLEASEVEVRPNVAKTGKLSGFSYGFEGRTFTAAGLGRGYTFANMVKRGLNYEKDRDAERINQCNPRRQNQQVVGRDTRITGVAETSSSEPWRDREAAFDTNGGYSGDVIAERAGDGAVDRGNKTDIKTGKRSKSTNKDNDGLLRDENEKDVGGYRNKYAEPASSIRVRSEKQPNGDRVVSISGDTSSNQRRIRYISGVAGGVSEIEEQIMEAISEIDAETYNLEIVTPSGWKGAAPNNYAELTAKMIIELIATLLRLLALGCSVVIRGTGIVEKETIGRGLVTTVPEPANTKKSEYNYVPSHGPRRGPR